MSEGEVKQVFRYVVECDTIIAVVDAESCEPDSLGWHFKRCGMTVLYVPIRALHVFYKWRSDLPRGAVDLDLTIK